MQQIVLARAQSSIKNETCRLRRMHFPASIRRTITVHICLPALLGIYKYLRIFHVSFCISNLYMYSVYCIYLKGKIISYLFISWSLNYYQANSRITSLELLACYITSRFKIRWELECHFKTAFYTNTHSSWIHSRLMYRGKNRDRDSNWHRKLPPAATSWRIITVRLTQLRKAKCRLVAAY